ncbi:MAG: LysR family transcriptional regulator [Devosia sp.]
MDSRFLETFLIVVACGSLAQAARRLGITPAAVAQRVKALERDVGMELVARAGRRVHPTDAGLALVEHGQRIVRDVSNLRMQVSQGSPVGELQVGAVNTALTGLLPHALKQLRTSAPRLKLTLSPGTSPDLFAKVRSRDLDAAVLVHPPYALPKALAWQPIRREPLVLLAHRSMEGSDPLDLLRTQPFLRYDHLSWGGRLVDLYLRRSRIEPREWIELDALEAMAVMVDRGLGVALVPDWPQPWPACPNLVRLDLEPTAPRREVGLVWHRGTPRQKLLQLLLNVLGVIED